MTTENQVAFSGRVAPKLADIAAAPLQRSGQEIKAGTYPALFTGFGEPYYQTKSFRGSKPTEKLYVRQYFLLRMANGECERISDAVSLGNDPRVVNVKSNLYSRLRAFANNNEAVISKDGAFAQGVNLLSFNNSKVIINVKVTEKEGKSYTNIESCAPASLDLKYPTPEEAEAMAHASEDNENVADVPF